MISYNIFIHDIFQTSLCSLFAPASFFRSAFSFLYSPCFFLQIVLYCSNGSLAESEKQGTKSKARGGEMRRESRKKKKRALSNTNIAKGHGDVTVVPKIKNALKDPCNPSLFSFFCVSITSHSQSHSQSSPPLGNIELKVNNPVPLTLTGFITEEQLASLAPQASTTPHLWHSFQKGPETHTRSSSVTRRSPFLIPSPRQHLTRPPGRPMFTHFLANSPSGGTRRMYSHNAKRDVVRNGMCDGVWFGVSNTQSLSCHMSKRTSLFCLFGCSVDTWGTGKNNQTFLALGLCSLLVRNCTFISSSLKCLEKVFAGTPHTDRHTTHSANKGQQVINYAFSPFLFIRICLGTSSRSFNPPFSTVSSFV